MKKYSQEKRREAHAAHAGKQSRSPWSLNTKCEGAGGCVTLVTDPTLHHKLHLKMNVPIAPATPKRATRVPTILSAARIPSQTSDRLAARATRHSTVAYVAATGAPAPPSKDNATVVMKDAMGQICARGLIGRPGGALLLPHVCVPRPVPQVFRHQHGPRDKWAERSIKDRYTTSRFARRTILLSSIIPAAKHTSEQNSAQAGTARDIVQPIWHSFLARTKERMVVARSPLDDCCGAYRPDDSDDCRSEQGVRNVAAPSGAPCV